MRDNVPSTRYPPVCNVCVNGESGSSLLIEPTDSMIVSNNTMGHRCGQYSVTNCRCDVSTFDLRRSMIDVSIFED